MCNSLWPRGLQDARLPCPSLSPAVCSSSCSLSQWYHPTISSFVTLFSSCPQSFSTSGFFHWCWSWSSNTLSTWYFSHQYWSFHLSTSLSNEYSGLISFRIDWFDLLAVQWTLKSLLQYHRSKTSILWGPTFIMVQLSHPHMTLRKTIVLTIQTFVDKVMSLH